MGDISKHFNRSEFRCKGTECGCTQDTVDAELLAILEQVREHFNAPVTISSGNRCEEHNRNIRGSKYSQHLLSRAADITVKGVPASKVYAWLDNTHTGGLGKYNSFTHIDTRAIKARWVG